MIISNLNPTNLIFTVIPATNQVGLGVVSVTVNDNDLQAPKSTTATIPIMVRPNTNVVTIDYFNYDTAGALDVAAGGFWQHLSGNLGQMQVAGGIVTVDTFNNTENLQTPLLGAPYLTNGSAVLVCQLHREHGKSREHAQTQRHLLSPPSTMAAATPPTSKVWWWWPQTAWRRRVIIALGIANLNGATSSNSTMFAQDLLPNSNYVVVVQLVVSTGVATLWINPTNQTSPSVTDSRTPPKFNISDFELRESRAPTAAPSA